MMVKRRDVIAGLTILPLLPLGTASLTPAWAQSAEPDTIPTPEGDISVHPVNHASLVLGFGDHAIYF
jgi:hypothetical protein